MFFGVSIRTRDHFLEAGLDLLAENGVSAVTIAATTMSASTRTLRLSWNACIESLLDMA